MAVGTVSTSILTDIANAIRMQAGVATTYKPREMAVAVAALDGTNAGGFVPQDYMELESGVLPESVFSDIADAIRGQNGESTLYQPADMAPAILALQWDVGLKPRAVLTSLGTLEFSYLDGRQSTSGGAPANAWEVDPAGYGSASARPYDDVKLQVRKVVIDPSWVQVGMTNACHLFASFQNMAEASGFENMSGITSAAQLFVSCPALETIYATSFSNSGLSGPPMLNGCNRLVGGTDGFVPTTTSGASVCKLGAGGVLTDASADQRTWFWAHFYADGEGVLTATSAPDSSRELLASNRICAIAKHQGLGFTPWDGVTGPTHRQNLTQATFAADMGLYSYLNLQCLFYSRTILAGISGLANLVGVRSLRLTFASAAVEQLDFRGFDPSTLTDLYYTFSGCGKLVTIYANASWKLPTSGLTGSQCFTGARSSWAATAPPGRAPRRRTPT